MRYTLKNVIDKAINETKKGGDPENAIALALIAIAVAINDAGDNVTTAIEDR